MEDFPIDAENEIGRENVPVDRRLIQALRGQDVAESQEVFPIPGYRTDTLDLVFNPDPSDATSILRDNKFIRGLLFENGDWVIWNSFQAIHLHVMREMPEWMKKYGDPVPVYIYGIPGESGAGVIVTDASKFTKWHHNPEVAELIEDHRGLSRVFPNVFVSYHDEDIVGDWADVKSVVEYLSPTGIDTEPRHYIIITPEEAKFEDDAWITKSKKILKVTNRMFHPHVVYEWWLHNEARTPLAKAIIKALAPNRRARGRVATVDQIASEFDHYDLEDIGDVVDITSIWFDEEEIQEEADESYWETVFDYLVTLDWEELWNISGMDDDIYDWVLITGNTLFTQYRARMPWRNLALQYSWVRISGGEGAQINTDGDALSIENLSWYYRTALSDLPSTKTVTVDYDAVRGEKSKDFTVGQIRNLTMENFHQEFPTNMRQFLQRESQQAPEVCDGARRAMRNILRGST